MSGVPLSQKARSLNGSTYAPPPANIVHRSSIHATPVHHVHPVPIHSSPVPVETHVTSTVMRKGPSHVDASLREIKRRYEDEARQVQQKYEVDYGNHLSLIKTIEEMEVLLDDERRINGDLENKYNGAVMELEKERRLRVDFEHENRDLKEKLRRAEGFISDAEMKISRLQQDVAHLDSENKSLRNEIHRLTDMYNNKVLDIEDMYVIKVRDLTVEVERLRNTLEQQRVEYENKLRDVERDWSYKYGRLEEMLREKERLIAELEMELRKMTNHINQLKVEYEEELRRQIAMVREEEQHRFQAALQNLEARLRQAEGERDILVKKNQDLVREIQMRERQIQDLRIHLENEVGRLKAEINELRNQMGVLVATNEKLRSEIAARDTTISRLEAEIMNVDREMERLKEIHVQEMNRMVNDHLNEQRRWEEAERVLRSRIAEMERIIRSLEAENVKLRADIERIKEHVSGNVHRTIFQTFVDYENTNVKHLH